MTASAARRATYQDVLNAPPNTVAQVIFGTLHTQPRPANPHTVTSSTLLGELHAPFRVGNGGPGGWLLVQEPELHLGSEPDIVVPDIAGWHREQLAGLPRQRAWTGVAPDWLCEVLSPSTQALDRTDKMQIYLRERVRHVWLIDPLAMTLEVYRHGGDVWHLLAVHRDQASVRAEPFESLELHLDRLWDL